MYVNFNQLNTFSPQKYEAPPFVLWCKLEVVRSCTLFQCSLLFMSKVMSGTVSTLDLTGFISANIHQVVLCFLQTRVKKLTFFKIKKWIIKVNQSKSTHIIFALCNQTSPTVQLVSAGLPQKNEMKYLGMYPDRRVTWAKHIKTKRKQLNLKTK
jgi:hypothetical protein